MSRHIVISVVLFLTVFLNAEAEEFPFNYDYSVFREDASSVFFEFYYAFDPHFLIFQKSGSGFEANGKIELEILRKSDQKLISKSFKVPLQLGDTSGVNKHVKLTGQINLILETGDYNLKVKASDFNDSAKSWISEQAVTLTAYHAEKTSISSIQLSTEIVKSSDVNSIFYKNTLEITPNPSALFGNNVSKLFYYAEIYGIRKENLGDKYSVSAAIEDNSRKELKNSVKILDVKTESKVEYGSFDISGLPSDKYTLLIKILDSKDVEVTRVSKDFYVYNSNVVVPQTDLGNFEKEYMMSEYPAMKDEQVQNEFDKAIYLMSYIQKNQYTSLKEPDARKMYMYKFWKSIERVITKKEYFSRVEIASKLFKDDLRDGWKTDRGRVYCLYGKPDDVERFPYQASTRAYEIWNYNVLQGGVEFVFIDMSAGYGDFVMVHSTAQNEIDDRFWRDKLSVK